jgi:hypothetical protein
MNVRAFVAAAVLALVAGPVLAQTQRTGPSAYPTSPTDTSADPTSALSPCYSGTNRTSPCYSGTAYPSYSAITALEESLPKPAKPQAGVPGADSLNEDQAKSRIEAKGYSKISGLQKDDHGIWRGKATMKDGRAVAVILDLEGDIYSELNR